MNVSQGSSRGRSVSSGNLQPVSHTKSSAIKVPSLALETIAEGGKNTLQIKSARRNVEVVTTSYKSSDCLRDCKGVGAWEISSKNFQPKTIKEISRVLNHDLMQKKELEKTAKMFSNYTKDLNHYEKAKLSTPDRLILINIKLKERAEAIEASLESKKEELRLVSCILTQPLVEGVLGAHLKILHLEHGILNSDLCKALSKGLQRKDNPLESLQLVSMSIEPSDLGTLVNGIVSRNQFSHGLKNVYLIACQINEKFEEVLEKLIGESIHLEMLDLETNELGSATASWRKKCALVGFLKSCNSAISSIANGTVKNQTNGGKLTKVILADNQLTSIDRDLLDSKGAMNIVFNISNNGLMRVHSKKFCYNSPRPIASLPTDRISSTPRRVQSIVIKTPRAEATTIESTNEKKGQ